MFKLMLLKHPLDFVPLLKDWALIYVGTKHKQKKLRCFQTISFLVTMVVRRRTLKQALNQGLVLKKVHGLIKFNQRT